MEVARGFESLSTPIISNFVLPIFLKGFYLFQIKTTVHLIIISLLFLFSFSHLLLILMNLTFLTWVVSW